VSGIAAIREMELGVFAVSPPSPSPVAIVAGENSVAVEIQVQPIIGLRAICRRVARTGVDSIYDVQTAFFLRNDPRGRT
jgi:hypothetical protein